MSYRLSRPVGFTVAGLAMTGLMIGAAAPSPLYPIYQQLWGFSSFTLTIIFAVYVVALLVTLLTVGSLADHIGRRPMLVGGLVLLAVAMIVFAHASGVGELVLARIVQGVATGAITGAVSALILDLQPSPHIGSVVTGGAPGVGLALGAAIAGGLVQHAPAPRQLVFWLLLVCYLLLAGAVLFAPEPSRRGTDRRAIRSALRPSVGVADPARSTFVTWAPALVATWALGGLYLSLGSSAVARLLGVTDHFLVGIVLASFFAPAGLALLVIHTVPQQARRPLGLASLGGGVVVTVVGVLLPSVAVYVIGSVIAGVGFGVTFQAAVSAIGAVTPADGRARTFAATYVLGYTAFSLPAVIAGLAAQDWGLRPTLVGYGALDVALVVAAALLGVRAARRAALAPACPAAVAPAGACPKG
ncbi:MFS transporter [Flexivirga oryzae]|uniref:MFS family permease n=1 Tax=Flexivirga oryzae TaxID=1794944 RepID=A0A839NBL1_9MICO|nr:MFS transporter [Flexivirga oryzae]MBB2892585.1 MFS family permease [Flexivirga oryzae]